MVGSVVFLHAIIISHIEQIFQRKIEPQFSSKASFDHTASQNNFDCFLMNVSFDSHLRQGPPRPPQPGPEDGGAHIQRGGRLLLLQRLGGVRPGILPLNFFFIKSATSSHAFT